MSVIGSNILAGASGQGGGYNLDRSLRLRSSASAYLNRTPSTNGNRRIWTISTWVKRGTLGAEQVILSGGVISGTYYYTKGLYFTSADKLAITNYPDTGGGELVSTAVYRDPSAWYHIVVAVDTTQATDTNRMKIYVNGVQVTSFSTTSYPTQNTDTMFNSTSYPMFLGKFVAGFNQYLDGYQTEVNFIDGQALTPSSFGSTNASTGIWQPKRYAGTYGTNGFYLPFTDNSALTSGSNAGLGKDFSGNGNYWNTNNISITSGATYDSMTDVPTLTSATAANFPTLNPIRGAVSGWASPTISNGNLDCSSGSNYFTVSTMQTPTTGKFYFEYTQTSSIPSGSVWVGVSTNDLDNQVNGYAYASDGRKVSYNTYTSGYGATWTQNDVIGVALDLDNQTITFYKNNVSQGTAFTGISQSNYSFCISTGGTASTRGGSVNFGQRPFAYTPPTGFVALNTYNLPTPTIGATASTLANKNFDATLYTGTGATKTVTNSGSFQPDLVWVKVRSTSGTHILSDAVRGGNKQLFSNLTNAEATATNKITGFTSSGFTLGADDGSGTGDANFNGSTYVGWQWKGGNGTVSNTSGSITSTVSANTSAGFSVVTYTGTGSAATVGHGLGVAPSMIITHARNDASQWGVYHKYVDASAPQNYTLLLNSTAARGDNNIYWNDTAPTSTVFSVLYAGATNATSTTYVAYCFSEVAGYSKFGSYTGNGSTDGVFIYTGFRPKFIMFKCTSALGHWIMFDSTRNTYNVVNDSLRANVSDSENESYGEYDFTSNGVKIRTTDTGTNGSGSTYIYMAFAENPFKYSLAR